MFDEDYETESTAVSEYDGRRDGVSPIQSMFEEDYETESVMDDGRSQVSPPQSVIEEEEDIESVYGEGRDVHCRQVGGIHRQRGNLSVVPEEISMENEEEDTHPPEEFDSTNFVDGGTAQAFGMMDKLEQERRKKHVFIEDDPRFNNSFNPKEHSWEPSPCNSRIEERNENNKSANTKSVKFSDNTQTRTLPPLTSSDSSTSTLTQSNEILRSPSRNTHVLSDVPSSSRDGTLITGVPSSPAESNMSIVSSVLVSTPNDRLTKKQHTKSLRAKFHDISAIGDNKENGGGRGWTAGPREQMGDGESGRLSRGVAPSVSSPVSTNEATLSTAGLIKFIQGTAASSGNDLVRALDQARNSGRILKKPDFGRSAGSTRTASSLSSVSSLSSRQCTVAPLSSSNSINTCSLSQPISSTTRVSMGRNQNYSRETRLPEVMASSSARNVDCGRETRHSESMSSLRKEVSERSEDSGKPPRIPDTMTSSRKESTGRSVDYSTGARNSELMTSSSREVSGIREDKGGDEEPSRIAPRIDQSTVEEPRRRNDKNTSCHSSISSRSSQYTIERVESRAESVSSSLSKKSWNGHDRIISISDGNSKEVDFGYVNVGESKICLLKGHNLLSFPITCRYSLKGSKNNRAPSFNIVDGTESIVQGRATFLLKLQFNPSQVANFYDYLTIEVSGGGIHKTHTILIGGKGGRAHVVLTPRSGLHPHRSTCEFLLQSGSNQTASIGVENDGERVAYVRAVVLNGYDSKVDGVVFSPSDSFVLSPNSQQLIKVDLSKSNLDNEGRCSSSLGSNGGIRFRRSSTASVNSLSSSASAGSRVPPAYKIVLYSGEESQRHRMIGWCRKHGHSSFPPLCPVDEDFSRSFVGENPVIDKRRPTFNSSDKNLFIASITTTTINVYLSGVKYHAPMDESLDGDRTLVPDDTFRGADDTMLSMDVDLTALRIRR